MTLSLQQFFILLLAFLCGFCIMSVELLGGPLLAPYFGGSVEVWGSIITVFMLALALGYLWGGMLSVRKPNLAKLGCIISLAGLLLIPLIFSADIIMDSSFDLTDSTRYGSLVASLALFAVPSILLGMVSPYCIRLLIKDQESSGNVAGRLYFVSTIGSALGTLWTTFYWVLLTDIFTIVMTVAIGLIVLGLLAITFHFLSCNHQTAELERNAI